MIIGISGKIGSGKDTVGKIIQYLTWYNKPGIKEEYEEMNDISFVLHWLNSNIQPHKDVFNWQIKKFADKLKECVVIITGIPREDLEKIEVKNSDLGDAWERWYCYHYKLKSDTNPKGKVDKYVATQLEVERQHDLISNRISNHQFAQERITVRTLLQEFGTEVGRQIHPNFWVNALFNDYKLVSHQPTVINHTTNNIMKVGEPWVSEFPNWIITDVRFPNELTAIEEKEGITIRLLRDPNKDKPSTHPSETSLDNAQFMYYIHNETTSIDELILKVKEILIKTNML